MWFHKKNCPLATKTKLKFSLCKVPEHELKVERVRKWLGWNLVKKLNVLIREAPVACFQVVLKLGDLGSSENGNHTRLQESSFSVEPIDRNLSRSCAMLLGELKESVHYLPSMLIRQSVPAAERKVESGDPLQSSVCFRSLALSRVSSCKPSSCKRRPNVNSDP